MQLSHSSLQAVTQDQIAAWEKQYKSIFAIEVEDKACIIRKPSRTELGRATNEGKKNPLKFTETILRDCFLFGDRELIEDDDYFLAASSVLEGLLETKAAELKKITN